MLIDAALDELVDAFEAAFGEDAAYIARCRGDAAEPLLRSAWIDGAAWATRQKQPTGCVPGAGSRFLLN